MPDDFKRELELLARELEELKIVLLRYAARDREEVLARTVGLLPLEQQRVLALRYQKGLTPKEAAAVLGTPEEFVYRMEHSALRNVLWLFDQKTDQKGRV
jgi:DNA-directed RNA polymerase specialized sigma24 family protein